MGKILYIVSLLFIINSCESSYSQSNSKDNKSCDNHSVEIPVCGTNEVYSECGNNGCQNTCENPTFAWVCRGICKPGCVCKDGYLKNEKNKCVLPEQCENGCVGDKNAFWHKCGDPCPITCDNKNNKIKCNEECAERGGCRCKKGFVKNYAGKCILFKDCPKCGKNEIFNCGSACDTTCATLGEPCGIINKKCVEMCYCIEGFARNDKGVCIPVKECPPRQCKDDPNAIIVPCGDPCPTTCFNKDDTKPKPCPKICIVNGCKCKTGYVKGPNGKCIKPSKCPKPLVCGKNEEVDPCPSPCAPEINCESYFNQIFPLCPILLDRECIPKCRCIEGFVRTPSGKCELPKKCCTDPNSELVANPNPCPGGTCENPERVLCKMKGNAFGCQCKEGYLKKSNENPICIPKTECPTIPTCPANEIYSECGNNACQNTCMNPNVAIVCKAGCKSGCICIDGYFRNTKGVCVPGQECDTCKENEVFIVCGSTGCENTCEEPDLIIRCTSIGCSNGCVCKEGFLRNKHGECVRPQLCIPGECNGDPNAEFDPCGNICPKTCENKDKGPLMCMMACNINRGCRCKEGFVQNYNGKCIRPEKCPKCGENEHFSCGSACDTTCATLGETCPIVNIKCVEQCYCNDGFARDKYGVCIPIEKCPPKVCPTDPNAIFIECPNPCPKTCENMNKPRGVCASMCIRQGCQCKDGYVLNKKGKCVLPKYCP